MYAVSLVARDLLVSILLIHVSMGSVSALEDDALIVSNLWVNWMINSNLGSVSFKYHDVKNKQNKFQSTLPPVRDLACVNMISS